MVRQVLTKRRVGGISTIEQQLVRTILGRRQRTLSRKIGEILLAYILLYRINNKNYILRLYMFIAYLGYRIKGCDVASRKLFAKRSHQLAAEEALFISCLLVYPFPKTAVEFAENNNLLPISNVKNFLLSFRVIDAQWCNRIERRMRYGNLLFRKAEQAHQKIVNR